MVSDDTKWVIGTVLGTGATLAGLMFTQFASLHNRMDRLDDRLTNRIEALDGRVRTVESLIAGFNSRLEAIERAHAITTSPR